MKFLLSLVSLVSIVAAAPSSRASGGQTCGSTSYTAANLKAASAAACKYVNDGGDVSDYPHKYNNYEGFEFDGSDGPFYEFPVLKSKKVYTGGSPGADRVVIKKDCTMVGVITHTGSSQKNGFVACSGTS